MLAELSDRLRRERHMAVRMLGQKHVAHLGFVPPIDIGVDEADRDRLDALCLDSPRDTTRLCLVERTKIFAFRGKPTGECETKAPGHDGFGALLAQREKMLAPLPADFDDVPKAFGRDDSNRRIAPLDQCVGGGRGAVDQDADVGRLDSRRIERVEHADRPVLRGRQNLGRGRFSRLVVRREQVGEGSSDINADMPHYLIPPYVSFCCTASGG